MRVYIDTETTGFSPADGAVIIEVAVVAQDDDGREVAFFADTCNPGDQAMSNSKVDGALQVNGITRNEISGSAPDVAIADILRPFVMRYRHGKNVHAFNNAFDSRFLARPPWRIPMGWWGECVMLEAMGILGPAGKLPRMGGRWKWPKLSEAVAFFNVRVEGKEHRALTDCRMTAAVHKHILDRKKRRKLKGAL